MESASAVRCTASSVRPRRGTSRLKRSRPRTPNRATLGIGERRVRSGLGRIVFCFDFHLLPFPWRSRFRPGSGQGSERLRTGPSRRPGSVPVAGKPQGCGNTRRRRHWRAMRYPVKKTRGRVPRSVRPERHPRHRWCPGLPRVFAGARICLLPVGDDRALRPFGDGHQTGAVPAENTLGPFFGSVGCPPSASAAALAGFTTSARQRASSKSSADPSPATSMAKSGGTSTSSTLGTPASRRNAQYGDDGVQRKLGNFRRHHGG